MSSTPPDSEFDLEKLFLPAWAQGSPTVNKYAGFAGDDRPPREHGERPGGRRPPRRDFGQQGGTAARRRRTAGVRKTRPQRVVAAPRERSEGPPCSGKNHPLPCLS